MSFGVVARNFAGYIQIDQDYANYEVTQQGVTLSGSTYYAGPLDRSNLVFVRPSVGVRVGQWGPYVGGSPVVSGFWPAGNYFLLNVFNGSPSGIPYLIASRTDYFAPDLIDTHGLRVYKQDGTLGFDSNRPYLKIAAAIYARLGGVNYHEVVLPPPGAGRSYWIGLNGLWISSVSTYCYEYSDCEDTNFGYLAEFVNPTTVRVYPSAYLNTESSGSFGWSLHVDHTPCILIAEY